MDALFFLLGSRQGFLLGRAMMTFWAQGSQGRGMPGIGTLRARYAALFQRFGAVPGDLSYVPDFLGPVRGEWVGTPDPAAAILYFHGGGFVAGSPDSHRPLVGRLVEESGVSAFAVQYRLAPESHFPAAVRDGIDAYRALMGRGVAASAIVLAGDEAGGGLAFAVALAARNAGLGMPGGIAALSPWADLSLSGLSILGNRRPGAVPDADMLFLAARHYLRRSNPGDIYASPVFATLKDFPPVMVHAGAQEILRDDASRLGDLAADAGVSVSVEIYDGMGHLFQAEQGRNESKASLSRLGQFIRARSAVVAA